jgi:hypothetical protein
MALLLRFCGVLARSSFWYFWLAIQNTTIPQVRNLFSVIAVFISFREYIFIFYFLFFIIFYFLFFIIYILFCILYFKYKDVYFDLSIYTIIFNSIDFLKKNNLL